eukprot:scaffold104662_cov69-Cyclotella_meneghiniana.AAC.3
MSTLDDYEVDKSRSWCSCASHNGVAGKCHCFSVAGVGAAATSAIRSGGGCNCWVMREEERRRWRPWFKS